MQTQHIPDNWKIEKRGSSYAVWDESGNAKCGAKGRTGKPCNNPPKGNTLRCRMHPGTPIKGELHPAYKHGKYSQYASPSLRERMALLSDGELTDLTENMLLIDARLSMLVETIDEGNFGATAHDLLMQYQKTKKSQDTNKKEQFNRQFATLGAMIESTADDYETWDEILKWDVERRDMAKTIHQMTVQSEGMMPAAQVLDIVLKLAQSFFEVNALESQKERESAFRQKADLIISLPIKE